jgi:centriolin
MFATETYIVSDAQAVQIRKMVPEGGQLRHEHTPPRVQAPPDLQLEDTEKKISAGKQRYS